MQARVVQQGPEYSIVGKAERRRVVSLKEELSQTRARIQLALRLKRMAVWHWGHSRALAAAYL